MQLKKSWNLEDKNEPGVNKIFIHFLRFFQTFSKIYQNCFVGPLTQSTTGEMTAASLHVNSASGKRMARRASAVTFDKALGGCEATSPLGCPRKLGSMFRINGLFHLLINGIYWWYKPFTNHLPSLKLTDRTCNGTISIGNASEPTINFQVRTVSFREGKWFVNGLYHQYIPSIRIGEITHWS